jgi:outer membrane immunogenic protein
MRGVLLAAAFVMLGAGAGQAADIEPMPQAYDWSGFYIGAHLGYGEANYGGTFDESGGNSIDPSPDDLDLNGIAGGAQAGWNWQSDNIVLGVEADVTFTDWSDRTHLNEDQEFLEGDVDLLATLRLRAGLAMDNWLFYVTGGGAIADATYDATDRNEGNGPDSNVDFNDIGYVLGGGVEMGLNEHWTVRAEGLYYGFDDEEDAGGLTGDAETFNDHVRFNDAWIVRGGVNFRF